ncbi:glycoside hydrolase family 3 N-terminal domain-containing protein [Actinokineospora pegani]|uniref:glycoside hydrolase family 3 N-terminal domain-containing protein n=1 Tax=Actinokineospora pegani TaxID=2654637 RepID=UPI0012EA0FA5|nr:glycoside hydrolase family 3 N-terminal domain-containing protein [Actinokineospora pegani]
MTSSRVGRRRRARLLLVALGAGALLGACLLTPDGTTDGAPTAQHLLKPEPPATSEPEPEPDPCAVLIEAMTPRDRLAQRLMVGVDPSGPAAALVVVGQDHVGGVFLGGNATDLLVDQALAPVRDAAAIPLTVAVDDEGGRVQRIDALDGDLPSPRVMAATMTPEQVRAAAADRGTKLRARGVTLDFAPVVDLSTQPDGSVIGDRSFSADPEVATRYAGAFAAGLRDAGLLPVLKHFPGHGSASGDSHRGAVSTPPLDTLRANDLRPYRELPAEGAVAVMTGHLTVPDLTEGVPASLSPQAYQVLRGELGFDGLTITDDLGAMRAVSDRYPLPEAVLLALRSGADIAFWSSGGRVVEVLDRLEAAVAAGELDPAAAVASLQRVLRAKAAC